MPSQNNSGQQFDDQHSITTVAQTVLAVNRFISFDGNYATSAGGAKDSQGISKQAADVAGNAIPVVTSYSYLVEAGETFAQFAFVKPDTGGTGKAVTGTATENCGRALGASTAIGQLVEIQITKHVHAA